MQTARAELHALLDRLPITDVLKVKRFCEALLAGRPTDGAGADR